MDLIPKPDQVVSAASNVAHKVLYGGLADLRPMPRTLIDEGTLREVYHYRPAAKVKEQGDPVLLVTPLAAPALCYDLRRGCSLVEHLVAAGRPTYLVEYGQVSFRDRGLGMEHWVDEVVPTAIREVSAHAGNRPVHVVGWSLGGIFAMLAAADSPDLPMASLTVVGSPVDVEQPYHRFLTRNALATGSMEPGDRTISLADIKAPVLVFGGATDGIAPAPSVKAVVPLLTGARDVRFEIVPGGHLGMLTGRRARTSTWQVLDEWVAQWSSDAEGVPTPTAKKAAKKAPAKKAPAKKTSAKKATPAKKVA